MCVCVCVCVCAFGIVCIMHYKNMHTIQIVDISSCIMLVMPLHVGLEI